MGRSWCGPLWLTMRWFTKHVWAQWCCEWSPVSARYWTLAFHDLATCTGRFPNRHFPPKAILPCSPVTVYNTKLWNIPSKEQSVYVMLNSETYDPCGLNEVAYRLDLVYTSRKQNLECLAMFVGKQFLTCWEACCLHFLGTLLRIGLLYPEDGENMVFRNVSNYLPMDKAWDSRSFESLSTSLFESHPALL
jgi:hypothetical protein